MRRINMSRTNTMENVTNNKAGLYTVAKTENARRVTDDTNVNLCIQIAGIF